VSSYKFVIKNVDEPHNLAFANIQLQHHTDFPYCDKVPDVALFHCIQNATEGGDSLWLDGFAVAEQLRREDPAAFKLLCNVPVAHQDITDKWDLRATFPTLSLDARDGKLDKVVFNERTRDSWRQWAPDVAPARASAAAAASVSATSPAFYAALRKYELLVEDARFHVTTPLQPGELVLFDNKRIMHSRTRFSGPRHMEVRPSIRLRRKLTHPPFFTGIVHGVVGHPSHVAGAAAAHPPGSTGVLRECRGQGEGEVVVTTPVHITHIPVWCHKNDLASSLPPHPHLSDL
jgi:hypothetical protein